MVQGKEMRSAEGLGSLSNGDFPATAPAANPVFYRTYSRRTDRGRETWSQVCDRTLTDITQLGRFTPEEQDLINRMQRQLKALISGRALWVMGTDWIHRPENFSGAYNCTSTNVIDWQAFGLMMDLAMMGCGTGAVLEPKFINRLPAIVNYLNIQVVGQIGATPANQRQDQTRIQRQGSRVHIQVGDSRRGWVDSYQVLMELASDPSFSGTIELSVDLSDVRPAGEILKGFGGVANPIKLPTLYERCAAILNKAVGRQLNSVECCLLIDEAASCIVAGNIRRSAGMRQFAGEDVLGSNAKDNLWQQDEKGNWRIDPERDALRMANHTRVFHRKPTLEETIEAVRKQFYSGEGAIQWAGEAVARANCDLIPLDQKSDFLKAYEAGSAKDWLQKRDPNLSEEELEDRISRYGLNPCVTADTWIHTGDGPRQVKDLIGIQHSTYVNGELFSTTPEGFFYSGIKPVFKLITQEGYELRLTGNHRVLKVTAQTQKKQYTQWVSAEDLQPGDRVILHDHRDLCPWEGEGSFEEGWLLGNLLGDGSLAKTQWSDMGLLRFWQDTQSEMSEHAIGCLEKATGYTRRTDQAHYHAQLKYRVVSSSSLARLAARFGLFPGQKALNSSIEKASYQFYRGFLRGLYDADGTVIGSQLKGVSVRLPQSSLHTLQAVQRMLARLGIISTICQNRRPAGSRLLPDSQRQPKLYFCQAQHELVISKDNLLQFQSLIGFQDPEKSQKLEQLLSNYQRNFNRERFTVKVLAVKPDGVEPVYDCSVPGPNQFDANGFVAHNCGEIIGSNYHCNLSEIHLNQMDPYNYKEQEEAFAAGALAVAALLNHRFQEPRYQRSREWDPIVGVSFTGLFDFFVKAFGVEWLRWWQEGRPETMTGLTFKQKEQDYLSRWREVVHQTVWDYCDRHGLRRPNRCTTVQPAGTKSLLTGAAPGWHPPKAQRYIRRITFGKNDPVALACLEYGYSIVPSQSDKDENGNLLNDPFDPRCTEWLVELPVEVPWANLPGADQIELEQFSALAQFDFYMQVQKHYTTHNTSATIELREDEVEGLGSRIFEAIQGDEGYISAALLARFDAPFPRLPFEKIDKATYERLSAEVLRRRQTEDFFEALMRYDRGFLNTEGPAGCDAMGCLLPEAAPQS
ncbi:MAG: ribonucleoside-triphosphate reductase, adenosylcobalamin-dependent [Thermostichus sp. HHBFW_bins_43]